MASLFDLTIEGVLIGKSRVGTLTFLVICQPKACVLLNHTDYQLLHFTLLL